MPSIELDDNGLPVTFQAELPTITVVVVNLNGKDILEPCLESVVRQTYDPDLVEIILIDNASTDGSVQMVRKKFPRVRIIINDENVGFSPAVNQAARLAGGQYLALLNNDAEADPNWLAAGAAYLVGHDEVGCVASLILRHDRQTIDYAGSAMAFNGMGYATHILEQAKDHPGFAERTLFASGGAMLTPTDLFISTGGFDETYFAFFEDVDYGWRLWVLGHETHFVPASKVFHHHHGTIKRFGYARERYLLERNALATIYKNYGDDLLSRTLPGAVLLTLMRGLTDLEERDGLPDFSIKPDSKNLDDDDFTIPAITAAHLAAMRDFGRNMQVLTAKRTAIQSQRVNDDQMILPLFKETLRPNVNGREYLEVWKAVEEAFDLPDHLTGKTHVLIITGDTLSERMAGPAIRCFEMATVLFNAGFDVTLASMSPPSVHSRGFTVTWTGAPGGINALLDEADIVVFQGFVMHAAPEIEAFEGPVIVDIYDPFHLEGMSHRKHELDWQRYATHNSDTDVLNKQMMRGDFFVCASEKQRDLWLGQMSALKRINPATFDEDESLRSLIDIAPFGLSAGEPVKTVDRVLRGVVEGIDEDDFLLLWGGGIYNWFDPLTLIKAVGQVAADHPDVKLWFMGSAHPNPDVPKMQMAANCYNLSVELGLLGKHVFFNDGWIDYTQRQNYLMEADVGVSTHYEHLETRYSFRTRILDYIWCELPIIATEGDTLSLLAKERNLGLTVPPEDVEACAEAIRRLRDDKELYQQCVANLVTIKPEMTWEKALQPVVDFCRNPRRAADSKGVRRTYISSNFTMADVQMNRSAYYYGKKFLVTATSQGPRTAAFHARNIIKHYLSKR
ncbi:MAG: glycosyltransferase [Euzebya sp.]